MNQQSLHLAINESGGNPSASRSPMAAGTPKTTSSSGRRGSLSVKLTKTSSARPLLYSKIHNEALLRIANLLQQSEKAKHDNARGKLPVEAAYIIMKRVTEASGSPILSTGLSTFNKLNSLSTDPALALLQKTTWREFFAETDPKQHQTPPLPSSAKNNSNSSKIGATPSLYPSSNTHTKSAFALGIKDTATANSTNHINQGTTQPSAAEQEEFAELRQKSFQLLNELGEIMIERISQYWKILKIPRKEQIFYQKSICSLPIQSLEQCKELSRLIYILQQHEQLTKKVLTIIQRRELALEKFMDVMVVLHRKFSTSSSSSSSLSQGQMFWKEELVLSLIEMRSTSMEVIRAIQEWRRSLWRPLSFIWKGVDYLVKMKTDFLPIFPAPTPISSSSVNGKTAGMMKILEMLPLSYDDLQGVVFISPESQYRHGAPKRTPSQSPNQYQAYIDSLLQQYHSSYEFADLQAAAMIVLEEESLQKAIRLEQQALTAKGRFIPILRPITDLPAESADRAARGNQQEESESFQSRNDRLQQQQHHEHHQERADGSVSKSKSSIPAGAHPREREIRNDRQGRDIEAETVVVTSDADFSSIRRPHSARSNQQSRPDDRFPEEESVDSPSRYKDDEDFVSN